MQVALCLCVMYTVSLIALARQTSLASVSHARASMCQYNSYDDETSHTH